MTQSQIKSKLSKMIEEGRFDTIPDNILFIKMKEYINSLQYVQALKAINEDFITEGEIYTTVFSKDYEKIIKHNFMTISFNNGSHIRFCPTKSGIDITRVISNKKGDGTLMMTVVLGAYLQTITNWNIPENICDVTLECTGSVGFDKTLRNMNISDQCRFFRKFGFRKFGKWSPNHVTMKLEHNDDFEVFIRGIR